VINEPLCIGVPDSGGEKFDNPPAVFAPGAKSTGTASPVFFPITVNA
jgi:hypothetical protein